MTNRCQLALLFLCMVVLLGCKPKQPLAVNGNKQSVEEKKDSVALTVDPPVVNKVADEKVIISISMLMPFNFEQNLQEDTNDLSEQSLAISSLPWIQFYEGAKLAADSFSNDKVSFKLNVFDSAVDSGMLATLVKGRKIYEDKILFAASNAWTFPDLVKQTSLNKVQLVAPQSSGSLYPSVTYLTPSNGVMISEMSKWMCKTFANYNVVIFFRDNTREKELAKLFSTSIDSASEKTIKTVLVNYTTQKIEGLFSSLDKTKRNCILIASSDEAFVSPVVNKLCERLADFKITLCGLPTWENFETIDVKNLELLNTYIFESTWINNGNDDFNEFRKKFISTYSTDPAYNAYQGFYFLKGLALSSATTHSLTINKLDVEAEYFEKDFFRFHKMDAGTGFINNGMHILKHENFELVKVN